MAFHGSMDPSGLNFSDFAIQFRLILSGGFGFVDFQGIGRLRFIGVDLLLPKTPQEKVKKGQSHDLGG